jgi:glutamate 5-kinase
MNLLSSKKIVIKIGSSLLINHKNEINIKWVKGLVDDITFLLKKKIEVIIVTSGAIALGCKYLNLSKKNLKLNEFQAVASIGQIELMNLFKSAFSKKKIKIGQILLTLDDTENRRRSLNAKETIANILKIKAIPIVNENDTTATSEIRYGDNDRLSARVSQICNADTLIMFSDIDGLYTENPNTNKKAKFIEIVKSIDETIKKYASSSINEYGTGGMITKLEAGKICMATGCNMIIAKGTVQNPVKKLIKEKKYTWFVPQTNKINAKKKWILSSIKNNGSIIVDKGALNALLQGKSLLSVGIKQVQGLFSRGDTIDILDENKNKVGLGVVSYSNNEIDKIKGAKSDQIQNILGYSSRGEVIHIDNLVLNKNE